MDSLKIVKSYSIAYDAKKKKFITIDDQLNLVKSKHKSFWLAQEAIEKFLNKEV